MRRDLGKVLTARLSFPGICARSQRLIDTALPRCIRQPRSNPVVPCASTTPIGLVSACFCCCFSKDARQLIKHHCLAELDGSFWSLGLALTIKLQHQEGILLGAVGRIVLPPRTRRTVLRQDDIRPPASLLQQTARGSFLKSSG